MKRLFTTMLIGMMTFVGVMAQLNIWYNGAVVYQRDYTLIDSITFTIQNPTSPTDITEKSACKSTHNSRKCKHFSSFLRIFAA